MAGTSADFSFPHLPKNTAKDLQDLQDLQDLHHLQFMRKIGRFLQILQQIFSKKPR